MEIILGDICYPKSEALVIPANSKGIMSKGIPRRIIEYGLSRITKEIKGIITKNNIEVGDYFVTGPGKFKRRGLKKIYHTVIKRVQDDFTSIYIVEKALKRVMKALVEDKVKSVAICGIGIDDGELDRKTIARITMEVCNIYDKIMEIKIIDDREEFIKELNNLKKE